MTAYFFDSFHLYQCTHFRHQVSITADTFFHAAKVPLVKWFWAIYIMAADKDGISAYRAFKHLGVSWIIVRTMLRKIRQAKAHRDSIYQLSILIECDGAAVGGKRSGEGVRGADGKRPVLVAVETREKGAGFLAMQAVYSVCTDTSVNFLLGIYVPVRR